MLKSEAVRVHVGKDAEEKVKEFGRERLLQSRFVITQPDDLEQRRQGVFKARRCIRGYLDPDLLELSTSSPTLSSEGLSTSLQLLSSFRWEAIIADIEAAFLRADPPQRRVLVRVPHGGIPGVDDNTVIELVRPVYGLWHQTLRKLLFSCQLKQSELDPCIYYKHCCSTGELQGLIAIHVDDLLMGGRQCFHDEVLNPLKEKFPFKQWHTKGGEFLRMVGSPFPKKSIACLYYVCVLSSCWKRGAETKG